MIITVSIQESNIKIVLNIFTSENLRHYTAKIALRDIFRYQFNILSNIEIDFLSKYLIDQHVLPYLLSVAQYLVMLAIF